MMSTTTTVNDTELDGDEAGGKKEIIEAKLSKSDDIVFEVMDIDNSHHHSKESVDDSSLVVNVNNLKINIDRHVVDKKDEEIINKTGENKQMDQVQSKLSPDPIETDENGVRNDEASAQARTLESAPPDESESRVSQKGGTGEQSDKSEVAAAADIQQQQQQDNHKFSELDVDMHNEQDDVPCVVVEEDPIGMPDVDFVDLVEKETQDKVTSSEELTSKGADEELCIIPDTEREITQEEKDAATAAAAAATSSSTNTKPQTDSSDMIELDVSPNSAVSDKNLTETEILVPDEVSDRICDHCEKVRPCPYKVKNGDKENYFCQDSCKKQFIELKHQNEPSTCSTDAILPFTRKCAQCSCLVEADDLKVLSWETMEFCSEDCLAIHQNNIGKTCAYCNKEVVMSSMGKYCVRFGSDIRQFCCSTCLEEYKKGLKVCSYCQKDISGGSDGFLAPVGDKGMFKDFCSQVCMEKFERMSNKTLAVTPFPDTSPCAVCNTEKQVDIIFEDHGDESKFCSNICFVAYKFVKTFKEPTQCVSCKKFYINPLHNKFTIFEDKQAVHFCSSTCRNIYILGNRQIVPCNWCKVKKYNFDMIKKNCPSGSQVMMCSLNCLNLFHVSINAVSQRKITCDHCKKMTLAKYHLTMSDASIRNFCTYSCVMLFQNQFPKTPITLADNVNTSIALQNSLNNTVPVNAMTMTMSTTSKAVTIANSKAAPKRYSNRNRRTMVQQSDGTAPEDIQMPIITSVQSLANSNGPSSPIEEAPSKVIYKQQVIVQPAPLPKKLNKAIQCRPILHTKGVSCRPHPCSKETQTDTMKEKTIYVPVPVPIYVPTPMHMFSAPTPILVPVPIPIPVPIFIPTTRNSAAGIMKEIKKIQVKIPSDPFEAELLMMAEMVAGEKKIEHTDSESEEDDDAVGDAADAGFSPETIETSNTFGEDMLQMALKMATELDEPAVDLEGALTANTITAQQEAAGDGGGSEENPDEPQAIHQQMMDRSLSRGRKRINRPSRAVNQNKRGRRLSHQVDIPMLPPPQPVPPPEPVEKPDANMCLKYTFGVNAWKQWVTTKNAELEKSSRRVKLFKNEILQLTADELNYSLCLFVKEVRKPNGSEYAPDTIYYLCLGIQQYLFENGRIDNIFTDAYYDKFTDCLDEVAKKFSILYNDSHYIVTRVEEEHLWESKQLGAHSPHVLLSTLMFFNTKHFNLVTVEEHMQLSFSHIMKHWKRNTNQNQPGSARVPGSRNVLLRFYPPQTAIDTNSRKKKVYEQQENEENPLRCPVKLYEFYLSKCPESVKTRNDVFYLLPERSCVPDSPVWYSTMALGKDSLEKMLHRVKMVKEINVALLTS